MREVFVFTKTVFILSFGYAARAQDESKPQLAVVFQSIGRANPAQPLTGPVLCP